MQTELILPFLTYAIATTMTPGPNNITSTAAGMKLGFRGTLPYLLGIVCGFFAIMILTGMLTNILSDLNPIVMISLKWIGVAYIIWLALAPFITYDSKKKGKRDSTYTFLSGLTLQIVNIKVILYGTTIYSTFAALIGTSSISVTVSAFLLASLAFTSIIIWTIIGSTLSKYFENKFFYFIFNGVLAILLIMIAVSILKH